MAHPWARQDCANDDDDGGGDAKCSEKGCLGCMLPCFLQTVWSSEPASQAVVGRHCVWLGLFTGRAKLCVYRSSLSWCLVWTSSQEHAHTQPPCLGKSNQQGRPAGGRRPRHRWFQGQACGDSTIATMGRTDVIAWLSPPRVVCPHEHRAAHVTECLSGIVVSSASHHICPKASRRPAAPKCTYKPSRASRRLPRQRVRQGRRLGRVLLQLLPDLNSKLWQRQLRPHELQPHLEPLPPADTPLRSARPLPCSCRSLLGCSTFVCTRRHASQAKAHEWGFIMPTGSRHDAYK